MSSDYQVILDAGVLVNAALRDTLLRLAEPPCGLYLPRWTKDIIDETKRTLEAKLGLTAEQTAHLFRELGIHFADARVKRYESFISAMANDPKDRHVLAAAVVSGAQTIEAQSPDEFLIHQYHLDPRWYSPRSENRRHSTADGNAS
jgi:hypothetical protein